MLNIGVKDVFNDLNYFYEQDSATDTGYGCSVEPASSGKGKTSNQQLVINYYKNIIKRFNHQNAMILSVHSKQQPNANQANGSGDGEPPNKKVKLKEKTTYGDLENEKQNRETSLNLQKSDRYSHGPTQVHQAHHELDRHKVHQGMQIVSSQCNSYKPRLLNVLSPSDAFAALMELSPDGTADNSGQSSSSIVQHFLSSSQQDDLKQLYSSATELLRHFWSCFPASTPFLREKVGRMWKCIESFYQTRVLSYKEQLRRSMVHVNATEHIEDMFSAAFKKYTSWQNKKIGKR